VFVFGQDFASSSVWRDEKTEMMIFFSLLITKICKKTEIFARQIKNFSAP